MSLPSTAQNYFDELDPNDLRNIVRELQKRLEKVEKRFLDVSSLDKISNDGGQLASMGVQNIEAGGKLRTVTFAKGTISGIGSNVLVLPTDVLAVEMSALDASTLTILGDETFAVGDFLRMKSDTDDEWLEITNIDDAPEYVVTRDKAEAYAADTNPEWQAGQAVVSYGSSGSGGMAFTSGADPTFTLFSHVGTPWETLIREVVMSKIGIAVGVDPPTSATSGTGMLANRDGLRTLFNSIMQFFLESDTGLATFAAGKAKMGEDGLQLNGLSYPIKFTAFDSATGEVQRDLEMGMFEPAGGTVPGWQLKLTLPAGTNLVANPSIETGDIDDWTKGSWVKSSEWAASGTFSAKLDSNSTTYLAFTSGYMAVTAGLPYDFSCRVRLLTAPCQWKVEIYFYTATPTQVGSPVVIAQQTSMVAFGQQVISGTVTAPATATQARIVVSGRLP